MQTIIELFESAVANSSDNIPLSALKCVYSPQAKNSINERNIDAIKRWN